MYAAFSGQLVFEEGVDHTMPCRLHLALECLRCYDKAEVCLARSVARHGRVVRVEERVVVNLQPGRPKCSGDLFLWR